jgi:hypothetical protein
MSNRTTAPDAVGALTVLNRRSPAPIFVDRGGGRRLRLMSFAQIATRIGSGIAVAGVLALAAV